MLCIKMELETNWLLAAVWQPSNTHSGTHGARIVSCFLSHGFSKVHEHIPTTSASQCRFRMVNNRSWSTSADITSVSGKKSVSFIVVTVGTAVATTVFTVVTVETAWLRVST